MFVLLSLKETINAIGSGPRDSEALNRIEVEEALQFEAGGKGILNIDLGGDHGRGFDQLDGFHLTNKPYPIGIDAGTIVMPKVPKVGRRVDPHGSMLPSKRAVDLSFSGSSFASFNR